MQIDVSISHRYKMARVLRLPCLVPVMFALISLTPTLKCFPGVLVKASLTKPDRVTLQNNGYSGVVVAIHEDVPENEALLDKIKNIFTEASAYIYEATKHRAFFRNITIIVPETWQSRPHYGVPGYYEHDVVIASPNRHWAPDPYTSQYQGCGEQGVGIRIGAEFVMDPNVEELYGSLGRLLVSEWGHYRWGLFHEYSDVITEPTNYREEFYFSSETDKFHGISCSSGFASRELKFDPNTGDYVNCTGNDSVGYEEGCAHVTENATENATGSIMFGRQFYKQIVNFCDAHENHTDHIHNRESPSSHNRLCAAQSCWQIMRDHKDFKDELNPSRDVKAAELVPVFHVAQARARRLVLLIDTSSSMGSDNRFERLLTAAAHFIQSVAENGSHVGIVQFNQVAYVCSWLVQIRSQDDRQILLSSLPKISSNWKTNYGPGLLSSLQVLSFNESDSPAGGVILMFADGYDAGPVVTEQALVHLVNKSVRVDTVACTLQPETFPAIAKKTGGRSYHSHGKTDGLIPVFYQAFADAMVRGQADSDRHRRTMVSSSTKTLRGNKEWISSFILDESIGQRTEIVLTWITRDTFDIEVNLTSPSGETIDSTYPGYQNMATFKLFIITVQNTAEVGRWEVRMRNLLSSSVKVTCLVTSYARSDDVEPIIVTPMLSNYEIDAGSGEHLRIYAEIRQGLRPVIGANVVASIYRPYWSTVILLPLLDNGAGVDTIQNDGVYSRYYVDQVEAAGFNTIQITVMSTETTTVLNTTSQPRTVPNIPSDRYKDNLTIGGFPIFTPNSQQRQPVGNAVTNLKRIASGFTSYYKDNFPSRDVTPPCRVQDLHVNNVSKAGNSGTVVLSWTAPGDDADSGTASSYDIRFAQSVSTLVDNFETAMSITDLEVIQGNPNTPLLAMSTEEYTMRVTLDQQQLPSTMTFALRAVDKGDRFGDISNVARATFRTVPLESSSVTPPPTEPKTEETTVKLTVKPSSMVTTQPTEPTTEETTVKLTVKPSSVVTTPPTEPTTEETTVKLTVKPSSMVTTPPTEPTTEETTVKLTVKQSSTAKAEPLQTKSWGRERVVVTLVGVLATCGVFVCVALKSLARLKTPSAVDVTNGFKDPSGNPKLEGKTSSKLKYSAQEERADIKDTILMIYTPRSPQNLNNSLKPL